AGGSRRQERHRHDRLRAPPPRRRRAFPGRDDPCRADPPSADPDDDLLHALRALPAGARPGRGSRAAETAGARGHWRARSLAARHTAGRPLRLRRPPARLSPLFVSLIFFVLVSLILASGLDEMAAPETADATGAGPSSRLARTRNRLGAWPIHPNG